MSDYLKAMLKQKKSMIPKKGYNLVGLDDYERSGEQLFLIGSFASLKEAEKAQKKHSKSNPDTRTFIYGPESA